MAETTSIPAPISWTPSPFWDGNDGLWNAFIVEVGTPPQAFKIPPSTAGQETWLPNPEGCTAADPADPGYCGSLRGAFNSSGFQTNLSSTWDLIGIFTLDAQEAELGYGGNGLYGFDTVTLTGEAQTVTQDKQVVAGVADLDYWLGLFGIGPKTINFTTFDDPIDNYMSDLVSKKKIASLSWGYTAGAHNPNETAASLTLGGYDTVRFEAPGLSLAMNQDNSRPLQVAVQKIIGENTLGGAAVNLLPTATYHFIDSTLPHIWLPDDAIQAFVDNFGLTYDNNTDLYLINDTMREKMLANNPTVTFVLANSTIAGTGSATQNVELPYAAFDLQASYPFYQNATNYFPIRKAANDSQYTIGRTFLQEAYLIADFERSNFTVAQASFAPVDDRNLVAIEKPAATSSSVSSGKTAALGGGEIAGIVVGAIVGLALLVLSTWFLVRRRKKQHQPAPTSDPDPPQEDLQEKSAGVISKWELSSENAMAEAPEARKLEPSELPHHSLGAELQGDTGKSRGRPGMQEMPTPPMGTQHRYELMGSRPEDRSRT